MVRKFEKEWDKPYKESFSNKVKNRFSSDAPLKQKLYQIAHALRIQSSKLEMLVDKLKEKDRKLFDKIVDSYIKHDMDRAKVVANEVVNTRKTLRVIDQTRTALESVILRLETVQSIGDMAISIGVALDTLNSIRGKLSGMLPELDKEFLSISETLSTMLYETTGPGSPINFFEFSSEEAETILREAISIAESRTKEKLSEIPLSSNTQEQKSS